jgi:hypothetical protein
MPSVGQATAATVALELAGPAEEAAAIGVFEQFALVVTDEELCGGGMHHAMKV